MHTEQVQRFNTLLRDPIELIDENGQPFEAPAEGTLGLLALGHLGLIAWRQKRQKALAQQQLTDQSLKHRVS